GAPSRYRSRDEIGRGPTVSCPLRQVRIRDPLFDQARTRFAGASHLGRPRKPHLIVPYITTTCLITIGFFGENSGPNGPWPPVLAREMRSTTSIPCVTLPNTA